MRELLKILLLASLALCVVTFVANFIATKTDLLQAPIVEVEVSLPIYEATYYDGRLTGKTMANGSPYDPMKRTCAIYGVEFGTILIVTHRDRSTLVRVTDRHDYNTDIDMSFTAFVDLLPDWDGEGRLRVTIEEVGNL